MKREFIRGKRIVLSGLEEADSLGNYSKWLNDQEVCKFNSHGIYPNRLRDLKDYIESSSKSTDKIVLGIFESVKMQHIGNISLQQIDWISRSAEYAILIGEKDYWRGGYGKEASDLILYHGFIRMNLWRIYCGTSQDNIGMQTLAIYMGMEQEGVRRSALYKNGEYKNIIEYGMIREEYMKTHNYKNQIGFRD